MSLENVKIGDKLRYLGGDPVNGGQLVRGFVYDVVDIDGDVIVIDTIDNGSWAIGEDYRNTDCFEKVEEGGKSTLDLITNLAQEVAKLKRELSELRRDVQVQAYEDGVNIGNQKLLRKEVYIYDTE